MTIKKYQSIGVIGAGTMGMGIAEVGASYGHDVMVYDLDYKYAQSAKNSMLKRLGSRVERGKITERFKNNISDKVTIVNDIDQFERCDLVIEAIVENLEIKQKLFLQLQTICHDDCLFASNTSSISITAIASPLLKPERLIGLHFFNPAPVMKLVEVISGMRSSKNYINDGIELCKNWNKIPVVATSTPGFIVNRVARPFYGEALKMLQERYCKPEVIDALMTSAGFRMGPFKLMDLIGMDVNLSVSKTVYASMYYDPKYRPSLIQQEMVSAQLLGKKTQQGFYNYETPTAIEIDYCKPLDTAIKKISLSNAALIFKQLFSKINDLKFNTSNHTGEDSIVIDNCTLMLTNGQICNQRIAQCETKHVAQCDLMLNFESCEVMHLAFDQNCPEETQNKFIQLFHKLGKKVIISEDYPALVVMRSVVLLINEAADAIENGVCTEQDVDLAMQNGVNYPIGLIQWAHQIGVQNTVDILDNLHQWFGDDKYRVSPWLRRKVYN